MVSPLVSTLISRKIKYAKLKQVFTTTTADASAANTTPTNYCYYYYYYYYYYYVCNSKHLLKCHNEI